MILATGACTDITYDTEVRSDCIMEADAVSTPIKMLWLKRNVICASILFITYSVVFILWQYVFIVGLLLLVGNFAMPFTLLKLEEHLAKYYGDPVSSPGHIMRLVKWLLLTWGLFATLKWISMVIRYGTFNFTELPV